MVIFVEVGFDQELAVHCRNDDCIHYDDNLMTTMVCLYTHW